MHNTIFVANATKIHTGRKVLINYIFTTIARILICIGNSFRPIFLVFIVVFILCYLIPFAEALQNSKLRKSNCVHKIRTALIFIAAPSLILLASFSLASTTTNQVLASRLADSNLQIRG